MDAERLLRLYLEQRRELGEHELVLDQLSVDEVLRILGAQPGSDTAARGTRDTREKRVDDKQVAPGASPGKQPPDPRDAAFDVHGTDWRTVLGASAPPAAPAPAPTQPTGDFAPVTVVRERGAELLSPALAANSISDLETLVRGCRQCPLYSTALNPVPGEGNPQAGFMCVGEAPGAAEDESGRPFVGAAGQLLTKILAAINLRREDVFIANVLKHRPPGNRNPRPEEVEACRPYLLRQIALIKPRVILALGTFAAQSLLETKLSIGRLRGTVHSFEGTPVVVTYHPAALLRNPSWKRPAWEDVQLARRILDSATA